LLLPMKYGLPTKISPRERESWGETEGSRVWRSSSQNFCPSDSPIKSWTSWCFLHSSNVTAKLNSQLHRQERRLFSFFVVVVTFH
jgi:hypothetical protein